MHASTPTIGTPRYVNVFISFILIDKDAYSSVCNVFELPKATKHICSSKLHDFPNTFDFTTRASLFSHSRSCAFIVASQNKIRYGILNRN